MVLDTGNMEGDQLSQIQGHLALTVWMLPYEVVSCLDEDDSVLLEPRHIQIVIQYCEDSPYTHISHGC